MKNIASSKKIFVKDLFSEELFNNIKIREYILGGVFLVLILFMSINIFLVNEEAGDPISIRNAFVGLFQGLEFQREPPGQLRAVPYGKHG